MHDSMYEHYAPLSKFVLPIDRVPEDIQKRMIKVLRKHTVSEVREWSRKLMQSYQLLHAVEKPMNLDYAKPFANTSDLKNMTPKIFSELAQKKAEAEMEKKSQSQAAAASSRKQWQEPEEIKLDEDPVNKLISNAREAEGKRASKSDEKDELDMQEFNLFYQREHTVAYLQRKMAYHYYVYKRLIKEVQERVDGL